jgi:hypothetical protein
LIRALAVYERLEHKFVATEEVRRDSLVPVDDWTMFRVTGRRARCVRGSGRKVTSGSQSQRTLRTRTGRFRKLKRACFGGPAKAGLALADGAVDDHPAIDCLRDEIDCLRDGIDCRNVGQR